MREMLKYKRNHGSYSEQLFIDKYLMPLGVEIDRAGNLIKRIGKAPVLWSSHTDTVHNNNGQQKIKFDGQFFKAKGSSCLGADDCAGIWIMMEMIKEQKEGLYIFHRGEERGGIGSQYIAAHTPEVLAGIKFAIAFDRKGKSSVITHQFGRCCSDDFAFSMIKQMPGYKTDNTGTFTDTANYIDIVPECTNISVGYENQHSSREILDFQHLFKVKEMMLALDTSKLVCQRNPEEVQYADEYESYYGSGSNALTDIVYENPEAIADLLEQYGFTAATLEKELGFNHIPF